MKDMPKVSIIVPVYNGELYVGRCLDSILDQTYQNIEIICINDGSTDSSEFILKEYAKRYSGKVYMYTQENMGIGRTRNRGIEKATGDYLMFADNDDTLDVDYVEHMISTILATEADMVVAGYRKIQEDGTVLESEGLDTPYSWSKFRMMAPWTKIIRRELVEKNKILFGSIPLGEDSVFSITAINHCSKVAYTDVIGYNWVEHKTSVSNTVQKSDTIDATQIMETIIEINTPLVNLKQWELDYFIYKFLVWHLLYTRKTLTKEAWKRLKEKYFAWLLKNNALYQKREIRILEPKGEKPAIRGLLYLLATPFRELVLAAICRI